MFTLIKGAKIYAPQELGVRDVLLAGEKIAKIAEKIEFPADLGLEVVEAGGQFITPGLIDLHVHIIGGGGEGGPATRVPEIQLSRITRAGVTTVLGLLGTDDVTRHPETLLAKAQALNAEGITALALAGSYGFPPVKTVTGSLKKDIALIPEIVGVGEIALSDHRSAQPTYQDLARLAAQARVGGLIGGKAGLVQIHMGAGKARLDYLFKLVRETEIPIEQFLPTHVTREEGLFEQAIKFCLLGGNIDLTVSGKRLEWRMRAGEALQRLFEAGVGLDQITFSSDSNGSMPVFDDKGGYAGMAVGEIGNLTEELKRLILEDGFAAADILKAFTLNPAARLKLKHRKGAVAEGLDADLVIFHPDWSVDKVYARGRLMVAGGEALVKGQFE